MKTKAVRLYGKSDLRLEEFELPPMKDDEILARVVSDSICLSSYKESMLGSAHPRVPEDVAMHPVIVGHELCGEIVDVGERWKHRFAAGRKFTVQSFLNYQGKLDTLGYTFPFAGGDATYIVLPSAVMEMDCLLDYDGEAFFLGSLAEPMSCIAAAFHASYHTVRGDRTHHMGIAPGGNMAILAGAGPMGLGAIDYALHSERRPGRLVVTDIDEIRLQRARSIYPEEEAGERGIELHYVNPERVEQVEEYLRSVTGGKGYDDVMVFTPVRSVVEQADRILAPDGCLNFFAGPQDSEFSATINFYDVHYAATHVAGTTGGSTADIEEVLGMMAAGRINPATMITHIGGLNAVIDTTLNLPQIPGGKKLIYAQLDLELTPIDSFAKKGESDPLFAALADIVAGNNGLWSAAAEAYLLDHARGI